MSAPAPEGEAGGGGISALPAPLDRPRPAAIRRLRLGLLALWLAASFGAAFFARALQQLSVAGWPLHFWWGAQGSLMAAFLIVAVYAFAMEWRHPPLPEAAPGEPEPPEGDAGDDGSASAASPSAYQ